VFDANVDQKPLVPALDSSSQFVLTQIVNGKRVVRQADQALLRGLNGKSAIATITNTSPLPIPAIGQTATYAVDESSGFEIDQIVGVGPASTLKVAGTPTPTSIVLLNVDATEGAVVKGTRILPSGKRGPQGLPGVGGGGLTPVFVTQANTADITAEDGKLYICSNTSVVRIFVPATPTYTTTLRFGVASVFNGQNFSIRKASDAVIYLGASLVDGPDRGISNLDGVSGYSYIELLKVAANLWYSISPINVFVQIDSGGEN
jgi:hypothetical protein